MKCGMAIGILVVVLLMLPRVVAAQDAATSLEDLVQSSRLQPGDGVYVTDGTGRRIKGDVTDVSATGLAITDGRDTWMLAEGELSKIELQDPVDTGIWLGIGIAVGSTLAICAIERVAGADYCYTGYYGFLPALATGAGIGWYKDATTHKTIYQREGTAGLRISPVVSKERLGAQVSLGW